MKNDGGNMFLLCFNKVHNQLEIFQSLNNYVGMRDKNCLKHFD